MVISQKSDVFGAWASGLCLIHCLATPLLYVAKICTSSCCSDTPMWWSSLDYIFLGISLVAVYWSSINSSKTWVRYALWMNWVVLSGILLNEHFHFFSLAEESIYLPTLSLILLHIYNKKYCQCASDECCTSDQ
ncbi:MerC domain-containing protein [Sediminitomix flava]|uniref:MerC mercury resistance protein n=1 Tax=Sediminitomix flava TaxID=379075 RepID=A0A315ZCG4_SEDFL|nr:MerC domain-containing protein [Sediminitomix flava]PWJ42992.1 MerC mercury resistance protein [Sediminitomix flava]